MSRSICARSSERRSSTRSPPATRQATTPNPCTRCNGAFRFDALLAFAERAGAEELWTGHYARIVDRDGTLLVGRAADDAKDQSYMLSTLDPALLAAHPLSARRADEGGDAGRGRACRPRGGQEAREPGGVLPRRRRLPGVSRAAGARPPRRRDRRRGRPRARPARRVLAVHARPAARARRRLRATAVRPGHGPRRRNLVVVGPEEALGARGSRPRGGCTRRWSARARSSASARRRSRRACEPRTAASRSSSTSPRTPLRRARSRRSTTATRSSAQASSPAQT